eukprot:5344639-Pyramimonas_sp.AAC.1
MRSGDQAVRRLSYLYTFRSKVPRCGSNTPCAPLRDDEAYPSSKHADSLNCPWTPRGREHPRSLRSGMPS